MIATLIFSRNRPAQLDLCLRSLNANLGGLRRPRVLWRADDRAYQHGYLLCEQEHPEALFVAEQDFRAQTLELLAASGSDYAMFLCDDDIVYRAANPRVACGALEGSPDLLCFSLRLGRNTISCYSLRTSQAFPPGLQELGDARNRMLFWNWENGTGDLAYPGSTDGHIFRRNQLLRLISHRTNWTGPNELEDTLSQACQMTLLPLMASFEKSVLVNTPANLVNTTHTTNRHGERFHSDPRVLNDHYLAGARLSLESVRPELVDAAHVEMELRWAA